MLTLLVHRPHFEGQGPKPQFLNSGYPLWFSLLQLQELPPCAVRVPLTCHGRFPGEDTFEPTHPGDHSLDSPSSVKRWKRREGGRGNVARGEQRHGRRDRVSQLRRLWRMLKENSTGVTTGGDHKGFQKPMWTQCSCGPWGAMNLQARMRSW